MTILISYAETIGIFLLIIIISAMLWITPPKPWRYYWWGFGLISPFLISLSFHFYFHNPGNYPVGLCLQSEVARSSLIRIDENIKKISVQKSFLELKKNKTPEDDTKLHQLDEENKALKSDQVALNKDKNDKVRIREIMIIHKAKNKNYYVEWDKEVKILKLKENFVLQKTKSKKYKKIDCPKDLANAAASYIQEKEPRKKWFFK
jgi:hypothetical protein